MNEYQVWEQRKQKIDAFKSELKALVENHNLGKHSSDEYDGEDNYIRTDYYFVIDNETWYNQTIAEIIQETLGEF